MIELGNLKVILVRECPSFCMFFPFPSCLLEWDFLYFQQSGLVKVHKPT
jgi:hypothetical protein